MHLAAHHINLNTLNCKNLLLKDIIVSVLRLDEIHKEVSGNKIFKLHYFIEACLKTTHKTILTFGGAYSNHLSATAFLCGQKKIKCIGIIRGEQPKKLSHTLQNCVQWGMQIYFVDRTDYNHLQNEINVNELINIYGACTVIPEGGYSALGAAGAALIMNIINTYKPSHICTSVGTATTLAGVLKNNPNGAKIIAIPAIKNMTDISMRIQTLTNQNYDVSIWPEYHFGGYAKHTKALLNFMNNFYETYSIPTDFVYTAKMMYAVLDKVNSNYFKKGDHIICLHTGGLQGNLSLPEGSLIF